MHKGRLLSLKCNTEIINDKLIMKNCHNDTG